MNHGITLPVIAASPDYPVVGASGNRVEWGARPVICVTGTKFVFKNPVTLKKGSSLFQKNARLSGSMNVAVDPASKNKPVIRHTVIAR